MRETIVINRSATERTGTFLGTMRLRKRCAVVSLLGSFLMLGACAGGMLLSGCGGGNSPVPGASRSESFPGIYAMSVNQNSDGTVGNRSLPTGTGTFRASGIETLDTAFDLVDASRRAAENQTVTTSARYGDMTGTFSRDGSFDVTGTVRDYITTVNPNTGVVVTTEVVTGQTARFQGRLPDGSGSTTVTVTIGTKTTTGTVRFQSDLPTPTPTATATPAAQ